MNTQINPIIALMMIQNQKGTTSNPSNSEILAFLKGPLMTQLTLLNDAITTLSGHVQDLLTLNGQIHERITALVAVTTDSATAAELQDLAVRIQALNASVTGAIATAAADVAPTPVVPAL